MPERKELQLKFFFLTLIILTAYPESQNMQECHSYSLLFLRVVHGFSTKITYLYSPESFLCLASALRICIWIFY